MAEDVNLTRDLFGDLTTLPSGRRGRPAHKWSQSNADRVTMGLAMGYSDEEIAFGIGVSLPTLKKYYFSELKRREMQRARFELWRAETLARLAGDGNVGAMRDLGKIVDKRDRHLKDEKLKAMDEAAGVSIRMGKKEARDARAAEIVESDDLLRPGYGLN